jgi:DNA-binding response OmpR family regulator
MNEVKTRVLLVEDEVDAREILQFYLETLFDEVTVATNGIDGYNICKKRYKDKILYDVIITDIKMPKKNGIEMIEDISKLLPEQKYIIVSAHKDEEYLFKSISLNVIGYFVKPLAVDNIMDMLKKVKNDILILKQKETDPNLISLNKTYTYNKSIEQLYKNNNQIRFSKKELEFVKILLNHIGTIVSKEQIKKFIWHDFETSDATMRTIIKRVKDKISDDDFIISRKGYGYIIENSII